MVNHSRGTEMDGFAGLFSINNIFPLVISHTYLIAESESKNRSIIDYIINAEKPVYPVRLLTTTTKVIKCRWCDLMFPTTESLINHMDDESKHSIEMWERANGRRIPLPFDRIGINA